MRERLTIPQTISGPCIRALCASVFVPAVIAALSFTQTQTLASPFTSAGTRPEITRTESQEAPALAPSRNLAQRIKLIAQVKREVAFGEQITSVIVLDPAIATAEIKGDRSVVIKGLMKGDTILIISGKSSRVTYAFDVEPPPMVSRTGNKQNRVEQPGTISGSNSLYFTAGLNGAPIPRERGL